MIMSWLSPMTLAGAAAGVVAGWAYFAALRHSADALVRGRIGPLGAMASRLARTAALGGVLVIAARAGAPVLLSAALGILLGRALVLRRVRTQAP